MATYYIGMVGGTPLTTQYTSFSSAKSTADLYSSMGVGRFYVFDDTNTMIYPTDEIYYVGANANTGTRYNSFTAAKSAADETNSTVFDLDGNAIYPNDLFYWGVDMENGHAIPATSYTSAKSAVDSFNTLVPGAGYKVFDRNGTVLYPNTEYRITIVNDGVSTSSAPLYSFIEAVSAFHTYEGATNITDSQGNVVKTKAIYTVGTTTDDENEYDNFSDAVTIADRIGGSFKVFDTNGSVVYRAGDNLNKYYVSDEFELTNMTNSFENAVASADTSNGVKVYDASGSILYPLFHSSNNTFHNHSEMCERDSRLAIASSHLATDITKLEGMCQNVNNGTI